MATHRRSRSPTRAFGSRTYPSIARRKGWKCAWKGAASTHAKGGAEAPPFVICRNSVNSVDSGTGVQRSVTGHNLLQSLRCFESGRGGDAILHLDLQRGFTAKGGVRARLSLSTGLLRLEKLSNQSRGRLD